MFVSAKLLNFLTTVSGYSSSYSSTLSIDGLPIRYQITDKIEGKDPSEADREFRNVIGSRLLSRSPKTDSNVCLCLITKCIFSNLLVCDVNKKLKFYLSF